jgi:hypothetical protein
MLVGVANLPLSFPPSGTFYFINRPPGPNILKMKFKMKKHGFYGL